MEQINKQFVIGGATAQGRAAAMLQLTQAMGAGALRGEELNSILENAPGIARAIELYMGGAEGSIKKYAEEGLITAKVVKNAMFTAADETNARQRDPVSVCPVLILEADQVFPTLSLQMGKTVVCVLPIFLPISVFQSGV